MDAKCWVRLTVYRAPVADHEFGSAVVVVNQGRRVQGRIDRCDTWRRNRELVHHQRADGSLRHGGQVGVVGAPRVARALGLDHLEEGLLLLHVASAAEAGPHIGKMLVEDVLDNSASQGRGSLPRRRSPEGVPNGSTAKVPRPHGVGGRQGAVGELSGKVEILAAHLRTVVAKIAAWWKKRKFAEDVAIPMRERRSARMRAAMRKHGDTKRKRRGRKRSTPATQKEQTKERDDTALEDDRVASRRGYSTLQRATPTPTDGQWVCGVAQRTVTCRRPPGPR